MTAAELNALSAEKRDETSLFVGLTEQAKLTGVVFDFNAPLPPMPDYRARSWEPAARHYKDLTEEERERIG